MIKHNTFTKSHPFPGLILVSKPLRRRVGGWSSLVHQVRAERLECGRDLFTVSGLVDYLNKYLHTGIFLGDEDFK